MTNRNMFSVAVIVCLMLLVAAFQAMGFQSPAMAMAFQSPLQTVTPPPSPLPTATPPQPPLPTPPGLPETGQASISTLLFAVSLIVLGAIAITAARITKKRR